MTRATANRAGGRVRSIVRALTLCALLTQGSAALGQAYPSKPVRFLSGQPPGGATDFFARMVAQKLNETWKHPVIIEHRPGASGSIAVELIVKSPPDGHTLVFVTAGQIVINPHLLKLNYDPLVDLAPVAFLVHTAMLLVTHPSVPAKSVRDLIALAKARPDKLNFGTGGNGAPTHLANELMMSLTGTRMTHIPFKGAGPSILAVATGDVDFAFGSVPSTMGPAKAGRVRALGVSTAKRSQAWPELPTLAESGVPGFEMTSWYAFFGPSALPKDIVARLHADIGRIAAQPEFQERLLREGAEHEAMTNERFAQFIRAESERWAKIIRDRNVRAQ
ncbi:MAG TPA: tripartite tricarboxylate transporter substrate binding protein [Burkholderiales bacterium]|nr:tripartite tricarboxylate transporter substrate binding protein [Burkholderiales bacterium]